MKRRYGNLSSRIPCYGYLSCNLPYSQDDYKQKRDNVDRHRPMFDITCVENVNCLWQT